MTQPYTIAAYNAKVIQYKDYTVAQQLYNSYTVTEKTRYVHTAKNQDTILPRGGPIQNPLPPLLEVVSPQYKVIR